MKPRKRRNGWRVSPEENVTTVRPPGTKRAVTRSIPPRTSSWWLAHASRAWLFGRLKNRRSMAGPK